MSKQRMSRSERRKRFTVNENTPAGTEVELTDDSGKTHMTRTRSPAWRLGHGELVVMVEGRSGGYLASRLRIVS